ncbi:MAG: sigma 54-interacting transcriptional regulator [Hymenobacteraceae bacterium]|nr:sigma 54-interacting transcriptional regulator [Hymenobacteraceae bacterium]
MTPAETATLLYLQEAIATVRDKTSLFELITDKLRLILPFDAMVITTLEGSEQQFKRVYLKHFIEPHPAAMLPPTYAEQFQPVAGSPLERLVADPRLTVIAIAELAAAYPDFMPLRPLTDIGAQWMVAVPLLAAGTLVGVLSLSSRAVPTLTPADVALLERIGQQVALAVQNLRVLADAETRAADAALQLAVNNALLSHKDRDGLLLALATEIDRVLPHQFFGIRTQRADGGIEAFTSLRKESDPAKGAADGGHFAFVEAYNERDRDFAPKLLMMREAAALYQQPAVYAGAEFTALAQEYRLIAHIAAEHGVRAVLYVPLQLRATPAVRTVLMLADARPDAFCRADLALLERLVPQISLALDNLFAFEQIEALRAQLEEEKTYLLDEIRVTSGFDEIIGSAPVLRAVLRRVEQVAAQDTTVLIQGETGTGKELIARALHHRSPRARRPLIKLNCATLPAQLIESELFGHEKGAFTGAVERRIGKFELADGGTLFLDEIGELPLDLQAKLLRVLQEKEIERVGGKREIKVDVRVIAATNRVLEVEVAAGRFRQDLYYRLTAFPLVLPPLRERPEDVPLLVTHLQEKLARRMGKPRRGIRPHDLAALQAWRWPGNIRELEHAVEQAVILSEGPNLDFSAFRGRQAAPPVLMSDEISTPERADRSFVPASGRRYEEADGSTGAISSLRDHERAAIVAALHRTSGRVSGPKGAAVLLDINPKTLEARMRKLDIRRTVAFGAAQNG